MPGCAGMQSSNRVLKVGRYLQERATCSRAFTRERAILWCILAVTAVVYLRSLENGFVLDDLVQIIRNPDIGGWSFLWKGFTRSEFWYSDAGFVQVQQFRNYRPLILVWDWMDYHLFGLHPALWHASIVVVHLVAVWLVFKVSRRLADESTTALLAAAAFALTPIHAGTVVWMAACGMVLGTAFILAAFYLIISREKGSARNWTFAIVLYAGALLCHESMTVFPALVAFYAFLFDPEGSERGEPFQLQVTQLWVRARRAIIWQAPFALELLLYMATRKLVLGFVVSNPYYWQNLLSDAQAILTVPWVLATYLTMLAMPWLTRPIHRAFPVSSAVSPAFWVPLAAIALMLAAFLVIAMRSRRGPLYLFCAAWIGITLVPMLSLHSVPHLVQDYCLYLPSIGWCILIGDWLASVARMNTVAQRIAFGGAIAMFVIYAVALWRAQWLWHDDVSAASGYVVGFPESVRWRWALATHLDQQGDSAQAENEIRTALSLEPDMTGIEHPHSNELHHFLGELLARRGDMDGAVLELEASAKAPPDEDQVHPSRLPLVYDDDGLTLYNRGVGDAAAGRTEQAIAEISKAIDMMEKVPVPENGPVALRYIKLAELYDSKGNQAQVEAVLKEVDSMPEGELAAGLARARIRLNHSDRGGAERILRDLAVRYPTDDKVLILLGDLEFKLKHYKEALDSYQRAGGGWFADAQLHLSMAQSLYGLGREQEASDQCRLAEALDPGNFRLRLSCAQLRD